MRSSIRGVRFASPFSRIFGIACFSLKRVLGEHHATLQQKGSQLVDHRSPASDQPVAHVMHRLQVELAVRLDRNKPHVLAVDRFCDRLGIQKIVLVGLH